MYGRYSRTGYVPLDGAAATSVDEFELSHIQRAYRRQQLQEQSFCSLIATIMAYLLSDIRKKKRSFGIGVFTVFLVVSFITTLKSMIDVAPIAMLKVGQDQAGSIDLMMRASDVDYEDGDVNSYELHPGDPPNNSTDTGDHVTAFGGSLLVFDSFKAKLDDMNRNGGRWRGFSPRWTIPMKIRNPKQTDLITSTMLIVMDTGREAHLAIGPHFSKTVLQESELMVSESAMKFLNVSATRKGVFVQLQYDLAPVAEYWKGMKEGAKREIVAHLVRRMGFSRDRRDADGQEMVTLADGMWTLDSVHATFREAIEKVLEPSKAQELEGVIRHTFDVVEEFDGPRGKFPDNLGNVAIADCNYLDDYFSASLQEILQSQRA